jgi:hypothetical protein
LLKAFTFGLVSVESKDPDEIAYSKPSFREPPTTADIDEHELAAEKVRMSEGSIHCPALKPRAM